MTTCSTEGVICEGSVYVQEYQAIEPVGHQQPGYDIEGKEVPFK